MKKLLFVINSLGTAGAEKALLELLTRIDKTKYECHLLVLMNQGELMRDVPEGVIVRNPHYDDTDMLSKKGRRHVYTHTFFTLFSHGAVFKYFFYIMRELSFMIQHKNVLFDKLLWQTMACGATRLKDEFDLAVAFHEGGSSYYVSQYVKAKKKVSFIHISYSDAGYRRSLDNGIYEKIDRIFGVSDETKENFLKVYPEYADKTFVFHNMIGTEAILKKGLEGDGFTDAFDGTRIITAGRLNKQKAYEIAIAATKCLVDRDLNVRWYILGEGSERKFLESEIARLNVEDSFVLMGNIDNPYPYFRTCDIYAHVTKFEGKAIAIQEAQLFGKPIVASDSNGNREQIEQGEDGFLCTLNPEDIADAIEKLIREPNLARKLGENAKEKITQLLASDDEMKKLLSCID